MKCHKCLPRPTNLRSWFRVWPGQSFRNLSRLGTKDRKDARVAAATEFYSIRGKNVATGWRPKNSTISKATILSPTKRSATISTSTTDLRRQLFSLFWEEELPPEAYQLFLWVCAYAKTSSARSRFAAAGKVALSGRSYSWRCWRRTRRSRNVYANRGAGQLPTPTKRPFRLEDPNYSADNGIFPAEQNDWWIENLLLNYSDLHKQIQVIFVSKNILWAISCLVFLVSKVFITDHNLIRSFKRCQRTRWRK